MQYKVGLEIAAAFFLAVLYVFLWVQYGKGSQVNCKFRRLTLCVLTANVLDVVTACTISYSAAVPQMLNLLLNTVYLVVDALVGFYFLCYVYAYICPERKKVPGLLINRVCTWIYIATLALNLLTGHYIYFDADGQYQHGIFYPILFAVPLYYMIFASLVLWRNRDCFQKIQRVSIVIFTIAAVLGTVVQALFLPDVLIGLFGVALGVTIVAFSLETPDYQRLVETMDVLSQTKEEAERDKEKAMAADDNQMNLDLLAGMSKDTGMAVDIVGAGRKTPVKKEDFLSRISFLDTTMAMGYLGDSEEFYQEMLASYLHNNRSVELQQEFEKHDWENYCNGVHALKSTSLAIGAVALSGLAKELELAAKKGDTVFIEENHGEMMQEYELLLARIEVAIAEDAHADGTTETADKKEIRILVVDDDPLNLRIAQNMLSKQYQVSAANSGTDALKFLENHQPDLILLDLHMPGMDGFAVQDTLKKNPKWQEIPVIFLTADEDCETEIQGFQAGAMDFIKKPFAADIVKARVQRILELDHLKKCLQEEVRRQTKHTENLSLQIIEALAGAIDAKDTYTSGHSKRVAYYAREIARRVGKSEQEQRNIYFAAMLHDVGKIGVPDQIINKPDKLTDEEYAIVKRHPVIGADILKNVSEIPGIVEGARWHHERYDGSGYPDGLRGEEIPEGARIICVADAYDAMTSKRSYRGILPKETVKEQLKQGIGTQFDAVFAQVMLQMMEEDVDYKLREEG